MADWLRASLDPSVIADFSKLSRLTLRGGDLLLEICAFDPADAVLAVDSGADRIELYTETYARAHESGAFAETLEQFQSAAQAATAAGLGINAGHDLNLDNLPDFDIPSLLEVSIGHALTVDALKYGFDNAIGRYLDVLSRA